MRIGRHLLLGALALIAGCGSLFGVDFDNAHLDNPGSGDGSTNGNNPHGDGSGNPGNPGNPDTDSGNPDNPIPPVDGGCAGSRVLCSVGCVLRNDPNYGCGSCTPCAAPPSGQSNSCNGSQCVQCPWGQKYQGGQCANKSWVQQDTGVSDGGDFTAIWGTGKHDIYIMGPSGIFHSDGSGTWKVVATPQPTQFTQGPTTLWGPDSQNIFAMEGGWAWKHTPSDATPLGAWIKQNTLGQCDHAQRLWASPNATDIYAAYGQTLCHSIKGAPWGITTRPHDTIGAIWGTSQTDIYLASYVDNLATNYHIYHSTGSDTWEEFQAIGSGSFVGMWGIGGSVYAFTIIEILGMTWDSQSRTSFTAQHTPNRETINAMWGTSEFDVYGVGKGGVVLHSTDETTWSDAPYTGIPSNSGIDLMGMWGSGPDDLYVVGTGSYVFHLE